MGLHLDHVMYGVADLEAAGMRFRDELGLEVDDGGVYADGGTRYSLVLCRDHSYVELLAVHDPSLPTAAWVQSQIAAGDRLLGWAVRADDLDAVAARLGVDPTEAAIEMPDGKIGTWRTVATETEPWLPFFIQYDEALTDTASMTLPEVAPEKIAWIEVAGDPARLREWLGGEELPVRVVEGPPGLRAVAVTGPAGEIVIR